MASRKMINMLASVGRHSFSWEIQCPSTLLKDRPEKEEGRPNLKESASSIILTLSFQLILFCVEEGKPYWLVHNVNLPVRYMINLSLSSNPLGIIEC